MRKEEISLVEEASDEFDYSYDSVDYKASPEAVLESVDEILYNHGLEIVIGKTQTIGENDDSVYFKIEAIEEELCKVGRD